MKTTNEEQNKQILDYKTSNFVALLDELMFYIKYTTPTMLSNTLANLVLIKLFSDKLFDLCIPYTIGTLKIDDEATVYFLNIDNTFVIDGNEVQFSYFSVGEKRDGIIINYITKLELDAIYELKTAEQDQDCLFDIGVIPSIKQSINDGLSSLNIGNFKLGSLGLTIPDKTEFSEYTKQAKHRLRNKAMLELLKSKLGDI